jgi:hypothetical protein
MCAERSALGTPTKIVPPDESLGELHRTRGLAPVRAFTDQILRYSEHRRTAIERPISLPISWLRGYVKLCCRWDFGAGTFQFGRDPHVGKEISSEGSGSSYGVKMGQARTFVGCGEIPKCVSSPRSSMRK